MTDDAPNVDRLRGLARREGTPLLVLDADHARRAAGRMRRASNGRPTTVSPPR